MLFQPEQPADYALFACYAPADEGVWYALEPHFQTLRQQGIVATWAGQAVTAAGLDAATADLCSAAQIVLLLISPEFLAIAAALQPALQSTLARRATGAATIVPVLVRPVELTQPSLAWLGQPLENVVSLPFETVPEAAVTEIKLGIRRAAAELQQSHMREAALSGSTPLVQGPAILGGTVQGPVVGDNSGTITSFYHIVTQYLSGSPDAAAEYRRNRQAMLDHVQRIWVVGLLDISVAPADRIPLELVEQPDAVPQPWEAQVQELRRVSKPYPSGTSILNVFFHSGGALLLLGEPGAGKTMLLLELARDLIAQAREDETWPIPVIFNLSSWGLKRGRLEAWLADELQTKYATPLSVGRAWLQHNAVLPLLDGLDEVAADYREDCVAAINSFRAQHGLAPLVVCSRNAEYATLPQKLQLGGAAVVQPLTDQQISVFLDRASLTALDEAFRDDPALRALLTSPLMLSIAAAAFRTGRSSDAWSTGAQRSPEQQLFTAYIDGMFSRRRATPLYGRAKTDRYLRWLAQWMFATNQTIFLLDQLQPTALLRRRSRVLFHTAVRSGVALVFVLGGVLFGLLAAAASPSDSPNAGLVAGLIVGSLLAVSMLSASSLRLWFSARTAMLLTLLGLAGVLSLLVAEAWKEIVLVVLSLGLAGALAGLAVAGRAPIKPVDPVFLSWKHLKPALVLGLGVAVALAGVIRVLAGPAASVTFGVPLGACCILASVFLRVSSGMTIQPAVVPNQGIRRSLRLAVAAGVLLAVAGLLVGALWGVFGMQSIGKGIAFGLVFGVPLAFAAALITGGGIVVQHYILRALLALSGALPWRLVQFLDSSAERALLRQVGGGYIFYHGLLMEHFSALEEVTHAND